MEEGEGWWERGEMRRKEEKLTFRIELQDMDIRICVRDNKVEVFAIGEEIGG